jgi:hypothetical protein
MVSFPTGLSIHQVATIAESLQAKTFMHQSHQYVPVARERMAMAAQPFPGQLRQGGNQIGSPSNVNLVLCQR